MNPYGSVIEDHFRHPRNYGSLASPDLRFEEVNPFCGDRVRIELAVVDGNVREARFQGDLCVIAKAASSRLTEMLVGSSIAALRTMEDQRLLDALQASIPPARLQCALLPLQTLRRGLASHPI